MMIMTKIIAIAACLLYSSALTYGSKIGLLRTESARDATNARRLQTLKKISFSDKDLQSAFLELLAYNSHQWDSSMSFSMSMSMRYNSPTASPVTSPTTVRSTSPTSASPLLRSPTASPVVAETPTTRVVSIKTDKKPVQEQNASRRRRLSVGAVAGIAVVTAVVAVLTAMIVKNRLVRAM